MIWIRLQRALDTRHSFDRVHYLGWSATRTLPRLYLRPEETPAQPSLSKDVKQIRLKRALEQDGEGSPLDD